MDMTKKILAFSEPFLYLCNVKVFLTFAHSLSFLYIHLPMHLFWWRGFQKQPGQSSWCGDQKLRLYVGVVKPQHRRKKGSMAEQYTVKKSPLEPAIQQNRPVKRLLLKVLWCFELQQKNTRKYRSLFAEHRLIRDQKLDLMKVSAMNPCWEEASATRK